MERRERKKDLFTNMNHEAVMDSFLGKLGLYRKAIAKDGSCLFRAVAEQIFNCQAEHSRVRKECIDFMKKNKDRFEAFVEGPFDHHLFNLRSQKEWAGQVEIQALSMMYKCDFLVYKDINAVPIKATENDFEKKIILCYSNGNHYDSIYPFSHKSNLGLCQSIVFELLYGQVFPFLMMKDPENKATTPANLSDKNDFDENTLVNGYGSENEKNDEGWTTVKSKKQGKMSTKNQKNTEFNPEQSPLSPASSKLNWEVMRSIDPDGYRNIELEVWEDTRKEQQQKDQAVAAIFQFKKGDRCQVKHPFDERFYVAIIDDIFDEKCKIWIPELKERKTVPFSRLKPKEHNSGHRELSGYYKKQENSQENNAPRGSDEQQKGGRRRRSRNRKGNVNESNERSQQETPTQEDTSGRGRVGDKNRRRRNNSNVARTKEGRKDIGQEDKSGSQEQGPVEVSAFPALPKRDDQAATEQAKPDFEKNTDPATFWRKRREVEQMEKATANKKINNDFNDAATESVQDNFLIEENENNIDDDIKGVQVNSGELSEEIPQEQEALPEELPKEIPREITDEIPHEITDEITNKITDEITNEISKNIAEDISQEVADKIAGDVPQELPRGIVEVSEVKPRSSEKRVNWQDLQDKEDESTSYSVDHEMDNDYENLNLGNNEITIQTTTPVYNGPVLKETVIDIVDEESVPELDQSYESMRQGLYDTQKNYEILKNPARQEAQVEHLAPSPSRYIQPENTENGTTGEHMRMENKESTPMFEATNQAVSTDHETLMVNNDQERESQGPSPDHINHHPISAVTIQNEILNGNITYSSDPEGKDLPKDMEVLRHLYNNGIYMYLYFNGVSSGFPGGIPFNPVYPMMTPNAMYAMQQSYQTRAMMMPQNLYPQMQQPIPDESQQQQQQQSPPNEETHEGSDSPGYKPSVSLHQSPQYHTNHAMAAVAQQAMFNMNYGQMYGNTGHRPLYNYNPMFATQRASYRYSPNKPGFNRQTSRKNNNRYYRNDNQPNVKLHNIQSGYGQYSKEPEI